MPSCRAKNRHAVLIQGSPAFTDRVARCVDAWRGRAQTNAARQAYRTAFARVGSVWAGDLRQLARGVPFSLGETRPIAASDCRPKGKDTRAGPPGGDEMKRTRCTSTYQLLGAWVYLLSYFLAYPVTYPLPCTYLTWSAFFGRCWISTGTRIEVSRIGRHLCRCSAPAVLSRAAAVRERLSAAHKTARERLLHLSRHLQRLLPLSTRVPVLAILLGVIPGAEARHENSR